MFESTRAFAAAADRARDRSGRARRSGWHPSLWALALAVAAGGCGSRSVGKGRAPLSPTARREVGACANPDRDGMISRQPQLVRNRRDLNGDGQAELLVADRSLCTPEGNCHWNVYAADGRCMRYAGTIGAVALEQGEERGEGGFVAVRAWWRLTGGGRMLLEEHQFSRGRYRVVESLLCRRLEDDRIICDPSDRRRGP